MEIPGYLHQYRTETLLDLSKFLMLRSLLFKQFTGASPTSTDVDEASDLEPERIRMTMMEKTSCNKVYEAAGRWTVMISKGGME